MFLHTFREENGKMYSNTVTRRFFYGREDAHFQFRPYVRPHIPAEPKADSKLVLETKQLCFSLMPGLLSLVLLNSSQ